MNYTLTRDQIIEQCGSAATACWNYYNNCDLSSSIKTEIIKALASKLPTKCNTENWEKYAREHDNRTNK